ncbi:class III poly(R)-hydroxyalkanoic acid synthase subunit PhaE [Thiocapsa bogorovii]|uniref:Poly(3-hydroxyalkanoate) polymerase subunit PhaE n=1 Tax=Thiocapsa roseopersicina TaxID=1058 RepID=I6Q011_THIRO|nr:class III poly(R)-hydroxyalkanoic acid synthase subunit PhaE [Thiocapsa bogorovii]AFJ45067.1 PHA synthase additional subunit [Thiocapsa roseopersicina]UHD18440.1 class III poly(R)-hydroxyalkanoic acid synthase subunit PhaE [Thiocapsa bogorovii]
MSNETFFNDDWLDLQRQYWDSWTEMSRKAMGTQGGMGELTNPWESALDNWWKALAPAAPDASKAFVEKMMEQGKVFFRFGEAFASGKPGDAASPADGMAFWTKAMEDIQKRFSGSVDDGDNVIQRMMSFWEMPLDNWQRMMSSMSPMPGDALRNMPHDHVKDNLNRVLSAPGLGYTREEQGQYQELMRASMDYQKALQEYNSFYARLGTKSVERMGNYLKSVVESGKSIDSARAIYDNWVSCCETVYAEEVATPEYAQLHGHLVNAQMALKKRMAVMVDENLGAMNMPSRSELRTLQDRLQETRRENKKLSHSLHAIEKQVAALSANPSERPATAIKAAAPAAKAPVRKKAATKTTSTD